jgi:putative endonuclease
VYILASHSRRLYVGVTNDLLRRVWEHRYGDGQSFTKRYRIRQLVHVESFADVRSAIAREKALKKRHRSSKITLIERHNPMWIDHAATWYEHMERHER